MGESPTKKLHVLSIITFVFSFSVTVLPLCVYTVIGFVQGSVHEKLTLGITLIIAFILVGINVVFKLHIRSVLWIIVLGVYFCLDNIMPLLLMVAIGTVLDEAVLTPLHRKFRMRYLTNKEIDKRLP